MTQSKRVFKLTVPRLSDVSEAEWREYIHDAVGCWKGQFHPDNPLFDLNYDEVKVVRSRIAKHPVVEPDVFTDLASNLLKEAHELLAEFTEDGHHHPVCYLMQRINWLLAGEVDQLI